MQHIIQSIHVYPIKSLGGIDLKEAMALTSGIQYDRNWMLVDEDNKFMTQRVDARMCLFQQTMNTDSLEVTFDGDRIQVPLIHQDIKTEGAKIWDDTATVYEVDPRISNWFSAKMNTQCRLMRIHESYERIHQAKGNLKMSLADGYPYLFVGTESLAYLNSQLDHAVPIDRFRANVVVSTDQAHEEDQWNHYSLGSATFKGSHPCGRCNVITIDQTTSKSNSEPLKTLSTYRKVGNKVNFGMNVFCESEGVIRVGDMVKF